MYNEALKGAVTIGTQEWFDRSGGQIYVETLNHGLIPVCFFCGEPDCYAHCDDGEKWRDDPRPI